MLCRRGVVRTECAEPSVFQLGWHAVMGGRECSPGSGGWSAAQGTIPAAGEPSARPGARWGLAGDFKER